MPLVNVYNYLSSVKPHITYRFNCDIWPYNYLDNNRERDGGYERRSFTIKKITQPTFKLDTEAKKYYGNTQFVIPVFKFGDTEMSITFEETDNMEVYKFLCNCYGQIAYMRSAVSNLINIEVTQFDETMHNVVDRKHYIATLKSFENPSFNNNGYGSPVEISADFYVLYIYDEHLSNEKIDDKITLNHNGKGFIQNVMNADDYSTHLTGGKKAEKLVDEEIKTAPKLGGFSKNPKTEKRKQEIREEQAALRATEKEIVSDQYNNMFDSLTDEGKLQLTQAAIDEYTKRNKGKKRESAYEEFNADKGLFIAKYLDNITAEDGLSKDEIDAIAANLRQIGADEKVIEQLATSLGVYGKKYDELEKEYNTINKPGASSALDKKIVKPTEGPTGKKIAATGGIGKERITRESIKELVIAEFLGTNGTRRKEGNSNLVYMNSNDGGKQKANFGMGNTQKYLENIGLGNEKFTIINTKTNETVTGTLEELTNAIKSSDSPNESTASVWRLDEKSANHIENVSMSHITERVINSVDSEILANMDAATIGGYSHIEYGSGGSLKILGSYLNEHKAEAIADLKANKGQFSDNFVNEMMNNPKVNKIMYTKWPVKEGKNKGQWNSIDRRGHLTGRTGYSFKRIS